MDFVQIAFEDQLVEQSLFGAATASRSSDFASRPSRS